MDDKQFKIICKKLDGLLLLESLKDLDEEEKFEILKYSVGLKPTAKILGKDPSNLRKKIKKRDKDAKKE